MGIGLEPDNPILRPPADPKKAEAIAKFSKAFDRDPKQCEQVLAQLDRAMNPPKKIEVSKKC